MGYLQNTLPKYLVRLGCEVHVISPNLRPYYQTSESGDTLQQFISDEPLIPGTVEHLDGFTLHVVGHKKQLGYERLQNLAEKLREIQPDVVQTMAAIGWIPMDAAILKSRMKFKLFTGNHNAASTYAPARANLHWWSFGRLKEFCLRAIPGRVISLATEKCYGVTKDCAEIAWRFYGVQKHKVTTMHLGVDTDYFFPINSDEASHERSHLRKQLGFKTEDIVCIYTGKLTESKNAVILASAVSRLRSEGLPFCAVFIGDGVQKSALMNAPWSTVIPFMDYRGLGKYYRASDIGVWPTNESISMLDAAACGLPLVVSDGIVYREHVEGNGDVYRMNDLDDLVAKLRSFVPVEVRLKLGARGADKMKREFSMKYVAERRLRDYRSSLNSN